MSHLIIIAMISLVFVGSANAQSVVSKYDLDTIDSSIKCELSRVAKLYGAPASTRPVMKVHLSITGTETTIRKVSVDFFGNASYETTRTSVRGTEWNRNIHEKNKVNCSKSFVVDVGVFSCMAEAKSHFFQGRTIKCSDTSSASAQIGAGVKLVWFVETKIDGNLVKKREWKIEVVAPPARG